MKRIYLLTTLVILNIILLQKGYSQNTFISSIDKQSGSLNEIVTINGNGFDDNINNLRVYFGGAQANIISASTTILEVQIPANASFDHISVINLVNDTHVTSSDRFFISHNGGDFDINSFSAQSINTTGQRSVFDLCLCDFNNDGTSDIAATSNNSETGQLGIVTIFSNNSTVGSINLSATDISLDETIFTDCGDLNGDGLADLILAEGGAQNIRIYTFENTSAGGIISFNQGQVLQLPIQANGDIKNVDRIMMQDLDKDGRQDIITTNTSNNVLDIFKNIGVSNNIAFTPTPLQIQLADGINTSGLDSYDLNNDGFDEIILTPSRNDNIYILPNSSNVGEIMFDDFIVIPQAGNLTAVKAGDFNNDGMADLISIDGGILGSTGSTDVANIFLNTTTSPGGQIQFTKDSDVLVNVNPGSIDLGDLNGDGRLDIVTTSLSSNPGTGISILINNSTGSNLSFNSFEIPTTTNSRNIRINDIDGDGRPDIAFTHNVGGSSFGDISIFLNQNCVIPEISPVQNQTITICSNNPLELQATQSGGATYRWDLNLNGAGFTTVQESNSSVIDVRSFVNMNETGIFRVSLISDGGACENTSDNSTIIVDGNDAITPILNLPNGNNICPGDELVLSSNIVNDGSIIYEWTAPDGETSDDPEFRRPDFKPSFAGRYELVIITASSCRSPVGSIVVGARNVPFIQIDNGGFNQICAGDSRRLSVPSFDGFSYQWRLNDIDIPGETSTTLDAIDPGLYSLMITDETGCDFETPPTSLTLVTRPVPSFTVDPLTCVGLPVEFNATSTGFGDLAIVNSWDFRDGNTDTGTQPSNTFATAGTFETQLTAEYADLPGCSSPITQTVTVRTPQSFDIITPSGLVKCPSEELVLQLPENFQNYLWSTGDTSFETLAGTEPNESSNLITVSYTDDAGCEASSEVEITNFPNSELVIESNSVIEMDTIRLTEDQVSIDLFITAGTNPIWGPEEVVENNTSNQVTVFPSAAFTTVTLSATTSNDCRETDTIVIVNNSIVPRKTFSPNGDGFGFECWEILNAQILQGCTIYIFDSKGLIVHESSAPFDSNNCIWDGTSNGRTVPEGAYYYVLKCNQSEFNSTGSILLAR